jgi:transposase InsO family protein
MTADIVIDALTMAWFRRRPPTGLLHHSDRGSQYASQAFQDKLTEYGMKCSMSRKGNCWDNAIAESFSNNLKTRGFMGGGTPRVTRLGPICSITLRPSTTGVVATAPCSARHQHRHSRTGFSNSREKWRLNRAASVSDKRGEPQSYAFQK